VGIAALILEYSRSCQALQSWKPTKEGEREPLKKFRVMRVVLMEMCDPYKENRPNPLLPWKLLEKKDDWEPWQMIQSVIKKVDR
jgi:hypothetical protein